MPRIYQDGWFWRDIVFEPIDTNFIEIRLLSKYIHTSETRLKINEFEIYEGKIYNSIKD